MRGLTQMIVGVIPLGLSAMLTVGAAAQPAPPPMKMVLPNDCQMVKRLSRNTIYVTGPLRFGRLIFRNTKLRRGLKSSDDTMPFEVLEQQCLLNSRR